MISKTLFTNIIRCPRYAGLKEIQKGGDNAVVDINGIISLENKSKLKEMAADLSDSLSMETSPNIEAMMPYYRYLEEISAQAINEKFGKVIYSMNTYEQQRFSSVIGDYQYICFLDGFQETESSFNLFETKATTDKKYLDLGYSQKKVFYPVFEKVTPSIMALRENSDNTLLMNEQYRRVREKLFDRFSDVGRYVYDLSFQRRVVEAYYTENGMSEKLERARYFLCVLNSQYVYDGKMVDGQQVYSTDMITFLDLTNITKEYQHQINSDIELCAKYIDESIVEPYSIGEFCERKSYHTCEYFDYCWSFMPKKNSLFSYISSHLPFIGDDNQKIDRFALIKQGKIAMTDLNENNLSRRINKIQLQVLRTGKPFAQIDKIRDGLNQLCYPIYHLDFETFPCPIPRFFGEKPYMQSVFQFSIHIEREPGVCDKVNDHYGFLAEDHSDQRENLIKAMIDVIKQDGGSVLVYNQAFEKTRIAELMTIFPKYRERLLDINLRVFDLQNIVKNSKEMYLNLGYKNEQAEMINYYHADLDGSYSIKKVLPIFCDLSYSEMEIGNGQEAIVAYSQFDKIDGEKKKKMVADLIKYCQQDTWAMVEILRGLRRLCE